MPPATIVDRRAAIVDCRGSTLGIPTGRGQPVAPRGGKSPLRRVASIYLKPSVGWPERRGFLESMIRKLKTGQYRLYSRKADPRTGKRRRLGTFATLAAAKKHEHEIQYFKRQ